MTDKKLTDTEIKKALEWCERFTDNLVMANIDTKKRTLGLQAMQTCKKALDLINRLQAENEQWKEEANRYQNLWCEAVEDIQTAKAEAYKECIEKVNNIITEIYNKHIFGNNDLESDEKDAIINFSDDVTYAIDNLLKKLVGDSK